MSERFRVLVIDDDPGVRDYMEALVSRQGYQVFAAADGEEALASLERTRPDLITLDVVLPGMDGLAVLGELKKLGIYSVCKTTIRTILKEHGFDPGPKRGKGTWDDFIRIHAKTLWACDFMSVRSWTLRGRLDLYLLIFIHVETRRVWVSDATMHPNARWVEQQGRNFCMHLQENSLPATMLLHDRDTKFTAAFDAILKTQGIAPKRLPIQSPNLNAYAERFIQTLKHECLNHFIILGRRHLGHLVHEFVDAVAHDRTPMINAWEAARYMAAGVTAHKSALRDGQLLEVPDWGDAADSGARPGVFPLPNLNRKSITSTTYKRRTRPPAR